MQNSLGLRVHCAVLLVSVTDAIISLGRVSCAQYGNQLLVYVLKR